MAPIVESQFWNQETESSRAVDGLVHVLPFEPPPLGLLRSNRLIRSQQLLLLQKYCFIPCTPSYSDGDVSLDTAFDVAGSLNWWTTVTARAQTGGLVNLIREQLEGNQTSPRSRDGWEKAKQLFRTSMSSLGMHTRARLSDNTVLSAICQMDDGLARLLSCNHLTGDGDKPWHAQASLVQKLPQHDLLVEAAWNDKCVDRRGRYWNVSELVSVDLTSRHSASALQYHAGVLQSSGVSEKLGEASSLPFGALAGIYARAAVFVEKEKLLWKDTKKHFQKPFNLLASIPHVKISTVIGGIVASDSLQDGPRQEALTLKRTGPRISADAFASLGLSAQLGHFRRWFLDFSKVDARLDIGSATTLVAAARNAEAVNDQFVKLPTLEVSLQQQVSGPFCVRVDSRFRLGSLSFKKDVHIQDLAYAFEWCPEVSGSLKVVAWYSPTRNEGMMEFRFLEM